MHSQELSSYPLRPHNILWGKHYDADVQKGESSAALYYLPMVTELGLKFSFVSPAHILSTTPNDALTSFTTNEQKACFLVKAETYLKQYF